MGLIQTPAGKIPAGAGDRKWAKHSRALGALMGGGSSSREHLAAAIVLAVALFATPKCVRRNGDRRDKSVDALAKDLPIFWPGHD
jgi:hypothetical protein